MPTISSIDASWILDSRGDPTVHCSLVIDNNGQLFQGSASVPSGASTGSYEALDLRDGGVVFNGKGVTQAVYHINSIIAEAVRFEQFETASQLDAFLIHLDGTENKSRLGANAILAVSLAAHRAFASMCGLELWQYLRRMYFSFLPARQSFPRLMLNVINGGQHADNPLDIQEFMIVPKVEDIAESLKVGTDIYRTLKQMLRSDGYSTGVGDEGGFAPELASTKDALEYLNAAISKAGYTRSDVDIAVDAASSEFYDEATARYKLDGFEYDASELISFYEAMSATYEVFSIEDPLAEDDVAGWSQVTRILGGRTMLVGDDLFVTNPVRLYSIGVKHAIANAALVKFNQIGSVLETCQFINSAKENGYRVIISHRSGETSDDAISDLAYASQADFIKAGAPARGERVAKYNRLLAIAQLLQ